MLQTHQGAFVPVSSPSSIYFLLQRSCNRQGKQFKLASSAWVSCLCVCLPLCPDLQPMSCPISCSIVLCCAGTITRVPAEAAIIKGQRVSSAIMCAPMSVSVCAFWCSGVRCFLVLSGALVCVLWCWCSGMHALCLTCSLHAPSHAALCCRAQAHYKSFSRGHHHQGRG